MPIKELASRLSQQPPAMAGVRLRNAQTLHGQLRDSGEVKTLRAVQELSDPGKTPAEDAKEILENIGLVLAGMVTFPLMLLAVLTGWDGR
ncbi:MAG TPA: hypothetical protein VFR42_04770 [Candidatus Acidoferrum sp.]|nr:hypothetical protein [Candidatus Acidoferrum sp.]